MVRWQDIQDVLDWRSSRSKPDPNTVVGVFLVGAVVGVTAGLLLAPRSGQETRERLKQKAKDGMDRTKGRAGGVRDNAKANVGQAAEVAKRTVAEARRATREVRGRPSPASSEEEKST